MRNPPQLARCSVDGVPLLLIVYGGVVMVGCELCDRVVSYAPRETLEPRPRRNDTRSTPRSTRAAPTCFAEAVRAYHETARRPKAAAGTRGRTRTA